jgi:hypothetical protein
MFEDVSKVEGETAETYEAPRLTRIGNVRELLAGDSGSITDVDPSGGPTQSPHG